MRSLIHVPAAIAAVGLLTLVSFSHSATLHGAGLLAAPSGTAVISGKLLDAASKPSASATISLFSGSAAPTRAAAETPKKKAAKAVAVATATTDADGVFKFDKLAAGEYVVSANLKGAGRAQATVSIKDAETKDVTMTLSKKAKAAK